LSERSRAIIPAVDIMFLLERLESLVATGTGVPATRKVLVDKDAVLELIDQLRVAVPEEIHAAKRINAEGERIIEKANDEGARIIARAQEQATYLIGERGLTEAAQAEGRRIMAEAGEAADGVRLGADAYAAQVLESLEAEVRKALSGIEKGIGVLEARQAELRGEPEQSAAPEPTAEDDESRDLAEWPEAGERAPVPVFEEEGAGQTVPR
jgi:cell division septum initiation protein DivIVA